MKKEGKKGQITIFIILGIVLLFSTALIIYIRAQVAAPAAEVAIPKVADVPAELQPIKQYVEQCAAKTASDGLKIIQEHGGYIDTSQLKVNPVDSTEGNAIELFPNSKFIVPYWYYLKSGNNCRDSCQFDSEAPPLCKIGRKCLTTGDNSMEEQLQNYVKDHLKDCATLDEVRAQGFGITELANISVETTVRERDLVVLVRWPLQTTRAGSVQKIEEYLAIVPSKLKELYSMAYDMLNYESKNCFVEKHELNQLSFYQGTEDSDFPPAYAQTFGDSRRPVWTQQTVGQKLQGLTSNSLRMINVYNTSAFTWPTAPTGNYPATRQAAWDQTVFFPIKGQHDGSVNFFYYPWWKPYFEINPNQGGVITPGVFDFAGSGLVSTILGPLAPRSYEFYYQYSHPTLVEIRLTDDLDRTKHHLLRFAMESNIRSNKCLVPNATFTSFGSGAGLLCDPDFRTEENYTITVVDAQNSSRKVDNARIYFSAGDSCLMGYTDDEGVLVTTLPTAFGGFLNIKKDGYLGKIIGQQDISTELNVELKPIIEIPFDARAIDPQILQGIRSASDTDAARQLLKLTQNLTKEDTLILELNLVPDSYMDEEFEQTLLFDKGKWLQDKVKLVPGDYEVKMQLFLNRNITLPEEHDIFCTPLKAPEFLENITVLEDLRKAITPGCIKTPVDSNCGPRGDSQEDFNNGDCFRQGYTCESINDAIKKKSGAVRQAQKNACLTGGPYFGLIDPKTDSEWAQWLLPLDPCSKKGCTVDPVSIDIPSQNLSVIPNGGADLTEDTGRWSISDYSDISGGKITFYLFRQELPDRFWKLQNSQAYKNLSRDYRYVIEPEER